MEEVLLLANPIAGRGRGRKIARRITQRLREQGWAVRCFFHPPEQMPDTVLCFHPPTRAAIVVGGDGTLRATADRLLQIVSARDMPPLLHVPTGTANLMVRHLGGNQMLPDMLGVKSFIQRSMQAVNVVARRQEMSGVMARHLQNLVGAVFPLRGVEDVVADLIRRRQVVHLDAALANGRLFLLMVGVGIDGQIVHELGRLRRGPINLASYLMPAVSTFRDYRYPPLSVEVDGEIVFDNTPGLAFVGNVAEYGTGFPILPHARSDDRLLDVCVLPCHTRDAALRLMLHAAAGEHLEMEDVVYLKGTRIGIHAADPIPVQVDGEPAGFTDVQIELLPDRLPFIVP